jgi:RHS repeat-associated protein
MGFAYDANERQVKATSSYAPDAWTVYDASGNRVATKVNNIWRHMVYDAMGKLVAEYGQPSDGLGGVKYVQQDWQGSVRTATNANGFVTARTDHQAFGGEVGYGTGQRSIDQGYNRDASTRQGYGLTERDEASGLDHTWFRKNENAAGRWTSPDPYNGSMNLGDPQSFNRYSYVQNQPTNFVDPSGLNMENEFIFCEPDRWDPSTATLYPGKCYRYVSGGGNSLGNTINTRDLFDFGGGVGGGESESQDKSCSKHEKALNDPSVKAALNAAWDKSKYGKYAGTAASREQGGLLGRNRTSSAWKPFEFTRTTDDFNMKGFGAWGEKTVNDNKGYDFQYYYHTHPYREFEATPGSDPDEISKHPRLPSGDDHSVSKNSGLFGIIITKDEINCFRQIQDSL